MMKFRTEYTAHPACTLLDPRQPVVLVGSCFTDNIGERMRFCRWEAYPNVTGVLYNPASIANILRLACFGRYRAEELARSIVGRDGLWMSWLADSGCTTRSPSETGRRLTARLDELRERLAVASTLIVTFGTAWIYELRDRAGYVVANCHKFPAAAFERRRLSVSEITAEWNEVMRRLSEAYPRLRVIFTVSPVRHLKDGFEGNSRSKAILQLACEEICAANPGAEYFPAFEIMTDDLRDYRFYAADMLHPSPQAVGYIWEKFCERYLSPASRAILAEGERLTRRLGHRPIIDA
ncbi:MAG: GSCFA domain-containing protein [Bacteroides sp.]|nr:GSCFA domain-containing protein [Bacteroides sp.]